MQWLTENWIWILLAVGAFFFMTRMGGMGGWGSGRSRADRDYGGGKDYAPPAAGNRPDNLFDPVSGHAFAAGGTTVSTVYRGRAYYFENREDRDAFEANPEKFADASPMSGQAIGSDESHREQSRRRGGC